jgi:hypothetical protein
MLKYRRAHLPARCFRSLFIPRSCVCEVMFRISAFPHFRVPCAVCRVPCAVCRVPRAACRVPRAACRVPRVTCNVRATCNVRHVRMAQRIENHSKGASVDPRKQAGQQGRLQATPQQSERKQWCQQGGHLPWTASGLGRSTWFGLTDRALLPSVLLHRALLPRALRSCHVKGCDAAIASRAAACPVTELQRCGTCDRLSELSTV